MQTDALQVRPAVPGDARTLAEIHVESWRVAYVGIMPQAWLDGLSVDQREGWWVEDFAEHRSSTLIACSGGIPLGWISFGSSRDQDSTPGCGEVYGFYLRPGFWRFGIGRALWSAARDRLSTAGYTEGVVWVLAANARARRFYDQMGAQRSDTADRWVGRDDVQLLEVQYRFDCAEG